MADSITTAPDSGAAPAPKPKPAPARHAAPPPLTGGKLVIGTIALSLATFMNVLDSSIANVSIPAISGDLGVSPNQGTWVITSFAVANGPMVNTKKSHQTLTNEISRWMLPLPKPEKTSAPARNRHPK